MISLHKLHSHVYYEEVYQYKRSQNFTIKTLTRIAYLNFKNEKKTGFNTLGLNSPCWAIFHALMVFGLLSSVLQLENNSSEG